MLAGIISSPTAYSPRNNPEAATARRNQVLTNMVEQGVLSEEEAQSAATEPVPEPKQIHPPREDSEAPYFTSWLRQQVVDRYGAGEAFGGGLVIHSTLDLDFQRAVESIISSRLVGDRADGLRGRDRQQDRRRAGDGRRLRLQQGAVQPGDQRPPPARVVVQAVHAGDGAAAGPARPARSSPRRRSRSRSGPGSTSTARPRRSTTSSTSATTRTTTSARPRSRRRRPTPTTPSTASSAHRSGPTNVAHTANALGIQTDLSTKNEYSIDGGPFEPYNPALILGGLETGVTPLEMAYAYSTIGRHGQRIGGTMDSSAGKDWARSGSRRSTTRTATRSRTTMAHRASTSPRPTR